ncbi:hypothetical protein L1987_57606 [Smallanthus sonchifolius]|uniref:Uncharacterized protein n=1 Tax=Smallanthus sonchifolius TaxID=185202 RepID=A0ACB9DDG8_9ASTR|nr:hypothetical protein L1987_57606 [Smallanthus sonchifolius]
MTIWKSVCYRYISFTKEELFNAVKESIKNDDDEAVDTDSLSLDEFFRKYTSEDNDSFSKLIEKVNKNKRLRYEFLLEGENRDKGLIEGLKMDRITDGYGITRMSASTQGPSDQEFKLFLYSGGSWEHVDVIDKNLVLEYRGSLSLVVKHVLKLPFPPT